MSCECCGVRTECGGKPGEEKHISAIARICFEDFKGEVIACGLDYVPLFLEEGSTDPVRIYSHHLTASVGGSSAEQSVIFCGSLPAARGAEFNEVGGNG